MPDSNPTPEQRISQPFDEALMAEIQGSDFKTLWIPKDLQVERLREIYGYEGVVPTVHEQEIKDNMAVCVISLKCERCDETDSQYPTLQSMKHMGAYMLAEAPNPGAAMETAMTQAMARCCKELGVGADSYKMYALGQYDNLKNTRDQSPEVSAPGVSVQQVLVGPADVPGVQEQRDNLKMLSESGGDAMPASPKAEPVEGVKQEPEAVVKKSGPISTEGGNIVPMMNPEQFREVKSVNDGLKYVLKMFPNEGPMDRFKKRINVDLNLDEGLRLGRSKLQAWYEAYIDQDGKSVRESKSVPMSALMRLAPRAGFVEREEPKEAQAVEPIAPKREAGDASTVAGEKPTPVAESVDVKKKPQLRPMTMQREVEQAAAFAEKLLNKFGRDNHVYFIRILKQVGADYSTFTGADNPIDAVCRYGNQSLIEALMQA